MNRFAQKLGEHSILLRRGRPEILQVNVSKVCNLTCVHCHVNAGPGRKEIMTRETIDRVIDWLAKTEIPVVDLTGGAPEMIPDFRYFVERVTALPVSRRVIDRCNLTILLEPSYEDLPEFLARHNVEIIASMPCYTPKNVNAHFGIVFNRLYSITTLPNGRFAAYLRHNDKLDEYMELLISAFNPATIDGLMCRNTISVGWRGEVYDCDFNQQLDMQWENGKRLFLWDVDPDKIDNREIMTGDHCFGCTAGAGSSCGGAIA